MNLYTVLVLTSLLVVNAKVYQGSTSGQSFQYLGKFVFDFDKRNTDANPITVGTIKLEIDYGGKPVPAGDSDLAVYTYDDGNNDSGENPSWLAIYGNSKLTCQQKLSYAKPNVINGKSVGPVGLLVNFNTTDPYCESQPCGTVSQSISQGVRPRFWYVVIVHNSDCNKGVNIPHYKLQFLNFVNGLPTQLSVDEYGITPSYIVATCVWITGLIIHSIAHFREPINNPSVKLFHISFIGVTAALAFHTTHWIIYSNNGIGLIGLEDFANVIATVATILLWFLVAFVVQGYGISKALLSENSRTKSIGAAIIGLFSLAYLAMTLWYYLGHDDANTDYIFDSVPGLVVLLIQVIYAGWAFLELAKTYQAEDGNLKRNWYAASGIVFFFFFLSTPTIAIIALFLSPWVQFGVVTMTIIVVNTLVYGALILLLFPSLAADIFKLPKKGANFADDTAGYSNL